MLLNFEVLASSTIKRKKPWSELVWLGKDRGSLFLLDSHRVSQLYLPSGRTKRSLPSLQRFLRDAQVLSASPNGQYLAGTLNSGKIFIWHKDTESVKFTAVLDKVRSVPSERNKNIKLFVSDDGDKVLLYIGINGVFLWETVEDRHLSTNGDCLGTWVQIHNGDHQLPGEKDKEAAMDCVFYCDPVSGVCAIVAWVFNQEDKIHITILHLQWYNATVQGFHRNFVSTKLQREQEKAASFTAQWSTSSRPLCGLVLDKRVIKREQAYVIKLSPDGQVLAVAMNQKVAAHTRMMFYSSSRSAVAVLSDLKGCGANTSAKKQPMGRTWWISNMTWSRDGLLLVCITRHGSVAVLTKLGEPVKMSTCGCSIVMGPTLFLPLHPRIHFQKQQENVPPDLSESTLSERNPMSQRFSVTMHPTLPLLVTSDGYVVTVLQIPSIASYSGVMSALMQDVINLLPEIDLDIQPGSLSRVSSVNKINIMQFEGTSYKMSAEFLEDKASESDSMSSTGFLSGYGIASGEHGVGLFGLESMERKDQPAESVAPGGREAVYRAQNISLMALALGCACGLNWKKSTMNALDNHLTSVVKILQVLLRSNESGTGKQNFSPKTLPRALREFAAEGPSADTCQVRLQEAFTFFRMALELFHWDHTHMNVFPWAVRLTHGLVQELLMAVDIPDTSKISACVDVLALSERILRQVYWLGCESPQEGCVEQSADGEGELEGGEIQPKGSTTRIQSTAEGREVEQGRKDEPAVSGTKLPLETQPEESTTSVLEPVQTEREANHEYVSDLRETPHNGAHLSGAWLLLYNYTSSSCRKLFKKTARYSLQSVCEGKHGTATEKQLVTLLCQIQEKLQEFGVKIPSHSTVQKEIMKEMKKNPGAHIPGTIGALTGNPSIIHLPDRSKQDSLFTRKHAAQSSIASKDGIGSAQTSPVLRKPGIDDIPSTRGIMQPSDKTRVGLEAFSQTEQDQQALLSILYLHLEEYNLKSALEVVYTLIEPAVSFEQMVVELNASFAPDAPSAFFSASQDLGVKKLLRVLLQDYPLARVSEKCGLPVVQTLARFMAAYFSNLPLYTYPPHCPVPFPPFYFGRMDVGGTVGIETLRLMHATELRPLDRSKISRAAREQNLDDLWSANSALELMLVSGLLTEGAWLARNLGDWKNAFLLAFADEVIHGNSHASDLHKEALQSYPGIPDGLKPEAIALAKLSPTFQDQFAKRGSGGQAPRDISTSKRKPSLQIQHEEAEQEIHIDNESVTNVLEASLVSGLDLVPSILARQLDGLKALISTLQWVVPADFYLPAPPLYCPQPSGNREESLPVSVQHERSVRLEAAMLVRQILVLLFASNCAQACVRWYCEKLVTAVETWYEDEDEAEAVLPPSLVTQATQGFTFNSATVRGTESSSKRKGKSDPEKSPKSRVSGDRPADSEQKSLPSSIASIVRGFREFCILMWVLQARDKMSVCFRKYRRLRSHNADSPKEGVDPDSCCWDTLLWTTRLVPFTSFLGASGEIYDALLTLLSDMQPSLATAGVAAQFFRDPDVIETSSGKAKLKRLMSQFRGVTLGEVRGIEDATSDQPLSAFYRKECFQWDDEVARRERLFGPAPQQLFSSVDDVPSASKLSTTACVGAIEFETSTAYFKFLDMFFVITFTKALTQHPSNSRSPLLLPFARTLVASDVAALAKIRNKADTEGATKPPPASRLARSQSFSDVRSSKPLSTIERASQLKPKLDMKRSSSLGDVSKVGGTSGMKILGKQILEFLPKLVWLSRWSTESSPSHTQLSFVGASEGLAVMRVNVPLPLLVNCLWLLRNVYLAWECNAEVQVDITVQRGDLLCNVTDISPNDKGDTLRGGTSTRTKPKRRPEQFHRLPKSYSDSNIPEIVVLSPTTDEEEIAASKKVEKGDKKKRGKLRASGTAPPVSYYSDSEFALSSAPVGKLRESAVKRRNRHKSLPPRDKTASQGAQSDTDGNKNRVKRKHSSKGNRPVSLPSSPASDSFKHVGRPAKEKDARQPKEKQHARLQQATDAVEWTERSAAAAAARNSRDESSSPDSSSHWPVPVPVTRTQERLTQNERHWSETQELSQTSDHVSSRENLLSGDMDVYLVLRPREDGGAYQGGLPVLRMPAVVENGQLVNEQEKQELQHTENPKRNNASQTHLPYNPLRNSQTQTSPEELVPGQGGTFHVHRDEDARLQHARLPTERLSQTHLPYNPLRTSQTQTSPEELVPGQGGTFHVHRDEDARLQHARLPTERLSQHTTCSSQTQTDEQLETMARIDGHRPNEINPATSAYHKDGRVKLAWLPTEREHPMGPPTATPYPLLRLPGKPPDDSTAGFSSNMNKNVTTSSPQISSRLLNVIGQEPPRTGHVTRPSFLEIPVQRSALPLLRMPESSPPARAGLDLSKLKLLEKPTKPPSWTPLRVPEKSPDATGSDGITFRGIQPRNSTPGWPLLRMPERQTKMPDFGKMNMLQSVQPAPAILSPWPLLQLQRKSGPPALVPLATLMAFEKERKEKEERRRDINIMSEKENVRPMPKEDTAPSTSGKTEAQGNMHKIKSMPQLLRVEGRRWKGRDADERNTASRQRRRQKQKESEKQRKCTETEHRSEHLPKESKVIVVQPAQKRRKYDDKKGTKPAQESSTSVKNKKGTKPVQESSTTVKNKKGTKPGQESSTTVKSKNAEKSESKEAAHLSSSDESELVLSDISDDFELSDEEEKYFRVERSPRPLHSPELEEEVLSEYKRAIRSLPGTNTRGEASSSGAKGKRPLQHHRTRGRDAATQSSTPTKLGESISRKLEEIDYEVQPVKPARRQQREPITREKSVGVHFADELPSKPAYVVRKTVGIQVDEAQKFNDTRKPILRDVAVATVVPEKATITTASVGAQTEQLQPTSGRLPHAHAPVLPPDIFLNLKFPKLDPSNPEMELDAQTVLDVAPSSEDGGESNVTKKRQFLSVADIDSNHWSEIQATPSSDVYGTPSAGIRETSGTASREGTGRTSDMETDKEPTAEERSLPEPAPVNLYKSEKPQARHLASADDTGADAVTVGLMDSLDSTKPHRFAPMSFPAASQPDARTISRQRMSHRLGEMTDQLNAIDQISQNMEREFQSSSVLLRAIESIGQVMTPQERSLNLRDTSTRPDRTRQDPRRSDRTSTRPDKTQEDPRRSDKTSTRPEPRLWAGVVPRRAAEKSSENEQPREKVEEIDQSSVVDDSVDVNEAAESLHEESDRSRPSTRGSVAETVSEQETLSEASRGNDNAEETMVTPRPETLDADVRDTPVVDRTMSQIYHKGGVSSSKEPELVEESLSRTQQKSADSSDRKHCPERRKELKSWMAKKRSEQYTKWKHEIGDTREKEYQPYMPADQGSTFKKLKLAEKERGEKRREREGEHLDERMKDASSLISEMLAEEIPKPKEKRNLRYKPAKEPHHKSIAEKKKKANQRYGKKPTTRKETIVSQPSNTNYMSNSDTVSRVIATANIKTTQRTRKTSKPRLPEGALSQAGNGRESRDAYVTSRSEDRRSNFVVGGNVDRMSDHVMPSSSPGGAEFVTSATYRRHQKEKIRRSKEMEAEGYLGFENSRSLSQNELTRARPRPSFQEFAPDDIDRLLDDITEGSTLNEDNIEDLMNEDDELRDLLGDVLGRRAETRTLAGIPEARRDFLTKTMRRGDLATQDIRAPIPQDRATERTSGVGVPRDWRNVGGAAAWKNGRNATRTIDSRRTGTDRGATAKTRSKNPAPEGPPDVNASVSPWSTLDNLRASDDVAHLLAEAREAIGDDISESSGSMMSNIDWDAVDRIMNDV